MSGKMSIPRLAIHLIASIGVSKVVNDVIVNNTNVQTTADAVKVWTGSIVLGSIIAEQASKHVETRMNDAAAWYANRKTATAATTAA